MITRLLLLLCCCIVAAGAAGQDTLFLKNGILFTGRIVVKNKHGEPHRYIMMRRGFDAVIKSSAVARVAYSSKPFKLSFLSGQKFVRRSDKNLFTINAPSYCYVGTYPGVSVGLEYQRFLDSFGRFSVGLGAHCVWAGTAAWGRPYRETRINLRGFFFEPNFSYHPAGNSGRIDPSIGVSVPVGTIHRRSTTDTNSYYTVNRDDGSSLFVAALLQGEICFHSYRHYVFTLYGSCGAMLPAGATTGLTGQMGFKVGGRF